MTREIDDFLKRTVTVADYALKVTGLPRYQNEATKNPVEAAQLKQLFEENFGKVQEVVVVRGFGNTLNIYKQIGETDERIHREKVTLDELGQETSVRL